MADRHILYRIRAGQQGGSVAVSSETQLLSTYSGVLQGAVNTEQALVRLDNTGQGAPLRQFVGSFSAGAGNIGTWFGGRALTRLRGVGSGTGSGNGAFTFTLPGTTDLTTAFNQLSAAGLPEELNLVIEYIGGDTSIATQNRLTILPQSTPNPQIIGASSILLRTGTVARVEITRTGGVISDYVWRSIDATSQATGGSLDDIELQNPANVVWDASTNGPLPTQVLKGYAYRVVNAPSDGSGRFGEIMQDGDWVVWEGETFTSWAAEPHQWFVIAAGDVRRITQLESEFLNDVEIAPVSDRNVVVRGADYADSAGEIRMIFFANAAAYDPAVLNTTGDIDVYTDPSDQSGRFAIRLSGTLSTVQSVLPTLYLFSQNPTTNEFTRLLNLADDFTHQGDFGAESDYLSNDDINYIANDQWRIYIGTVENRYEVPTLDIDFDQFDDATKQRITGSGGQSNTELQRLSRLESQYSALAPLTHDVSVLTDLAEVVGPKRTIQVVEITRGYSLIADFRDDSTRYESAGVTYDNTETGFVRYTGLGNNLYRFFGFKVTAPADQILLWLVDGATLIPFVDVTAAGNFRINAYRTEVADNQVVSNEPHFLTRDPASTETLAANDGNVSTYTLTNFPANATQTSRSFQAGIDVFLNGVDTQAAGFIQFSVPVTNTVAAIAPQPHTVNLGPLHGSIRVTVTVQPVVRVSGSDLLIDLSVTSVTVSSGNASDVTIRFKDVAVLLSYTSPGAQSRVDNFVTLQDESGDYTFTGENELLITFQPHISGNFLSVVGAAIGTNNDVTEFNDINTPIPGHAFDAVRLVNTIDFRTASPEHFLVHSDLDPLLRKANIQWCYGVATLRNAIELTITEELRFTGGIIITDQVTTNERRIVSNNGVLSTEAVT